MMTKQGWCWGLGQAVISGAGFPAVQRDTQAAGGNRGTDRSSCRRREPQVVRADRPWPLGSTGESGRRSGSPEGQGRDCYPEPSKSHLNHMPANSAGEDAGVEASLS